MAKTKNTLDKDLMFSKIMPSAQKEDSLEEEEAAVSIEQEEEPEAAEENSLRSRIFLRTDDWSKNIPPAATVNVMENLVLEYLDGAITKFNCCQCDRCRRDVAALALNHLPSKYVVAEPAHVAEMMEDVPKKQVLDALVQAIIRVRANPRH